MTKQNSPKNVATVVALIAAHPGLDAQGLVELGFSTRAVSLRHVEQLGLIVYRNGGWHVAPTYTIEKAYDGNIVEREGRNGRVYARPMGWRWLVAIDGVIDTDFDTEREAREHIASLRAFR